MINLVRSVRQLFQPDAADAFSSILGSAIFSKIQSPPPPPPPMPRYTPAFDTTPAWNTGFQAPVFHYQPPLNNGEGLGVYSPSYSQPFLAQQTNQPYLDNAPFQAQYPLLDTSGQGPTFDVTQVDNPGTNNGNGLSTEDAEALASDIADGKSIAQVAEDYGISREEVLAQLESDGLEVEETQSDDGHESTTEISDPESGDTVAKHELTEQQDGVVVEEITDADGETTTTVIDEQGRRTELKPEQDTTREGINDIVEGVADGQSIEDIAEAQGLSPEQVIAQIEAAGYEYETGTEGEGPAMTSTTRITAEEGGEEIVSHETAPSGTTTSVVTDAEGNETRRTQNNDGSTTQTVTERDGRKTTTTEHADGSSTKTVTETDGRETTTVEDADGNKTTTVTYEQNGVTVEEVTGDDDKTTTTIIDEDGKRTELDDSQDISREGIDDIVAAVASGKSIEEIAEDQGLNQAQVEAQLRATGYVVETRTGELANGGEQYTTEIVGADDAEDVIASYSSGRGTNRETSLAVDSHGTETRTTQYSNGSSTKTVTETNGRETTTRVDADDKTTTEVTDNGYTLTTPPDGDLTLHRDEDGKEFTIARGTEEQSLAEELLKLNPDDSHEDKVLQAVIEEMLVDRTDDGKIKEIEDLKTDLGDKEEAVQRAIDEIVGEGGDESDVIKEGDNTSDSDPLGIPPDEETSNGEAWVPMQYDGKWVWVDPGLVEPLEQAEDARVALTQAQAQAWQHQEQVNVYALDPNNKATMDNASERINELLAPHGLRWDPQKPEGSLAEAQERLENANAWINYLDLQEEYRGLQEEANGLKEEALEIYRGDESYEDYFQKEGFEEVTESGSPANPMGEKEDTGELLHQSVVEKDGQLYLRNVYADRDEPLYKKLTENPANESNGLSQAQQELNQQWHELKVGDKPGQLQDDALAAFREANPKYFDPDGYSETRTGAMDSKHEWESGELTDTRVVERDGQLYVVNTYGEGYDKNEVEKQLTYAQGEEPEDLTQAQRDANQAWQEFAQERNVNPDLETRLLDEVRERHPDYFKPEGFTKVTPNRAGPPNEDPSGALKDQQVVERDGQLYLVNTYENWDEPLEVQLTYEPGSSGSPTRTETQQQFDEDWASWKEIRYSGDGSLVQVSREIADAERTLTEIGIEQDRGTAAALEDSIPDLEQALDDAIDEHGEGSVVPGGENAEQVEIDGEMRWVHPEVAAAQRELVAARNALNDGEDILARARELYGEQHPEHLDPNGFSEPGEWHGNTQSYDSTGKLNGEGTAYFVDDNGQLWLRNHYEDRDDPYEFQLTYAPGEAPEGRTEAEQKLDQRWADWWTEHAGDKEDPLKDVQQEVDTAETASNDALDEHGSGTTEKLVDTFDDDVTPVLVTLEGEQRWVHPDVAMALRALNTAENDLASTQVGIEEARLTLEESDYRSSRPSTWKLVDDVYSIEHEGEVSAAWQMEDVYLEANGTHGALMQARQNQVDSQAALLSTQIGLAQVGLGGNGLTQNGVPLTESIGPQSNVSDLREALESTEAVGDQLDEAGRWNDFLRGESLDDRLDPEQWAQQQERLFQENPVVANEAITDNQNELPDSVSMDDKDARQWISQALGAGASEDVNSEVVDPVIDQIRDIAGDDVEVDIIPLLYRDKSEGVRDTALFRFEDQDGKIWLVDESGSKYRNFDDYRHNNYLSDSGHIYAPKDLDRLTDADGNARYEWLQARELSFAEEWLDPVIGIGTGIATVASFIPPLAPIAAPIAFAGGAYFGARSAHNLHEMHEHGRPLASTEGLMQGAMLVTSVLPMGSSAFRFAGLARTGTPIGVSARTSIGAVNTSERFLSQNPIYRSATDQLRANNFAFNTAKGLDRAAMGVGIPLMGYSGYNILANWDDMTGLERADALAGLGSGIFGVGMSAKSLRASRPDSQPAGPLIPDKLFSRHGDATPPEKLSRLYRLNDLNVLNQASVDGALPPGHYVHFVQPERLGASGFVLHEGKVRRGGFVGESGHINKNNVDRSKGPKGPMEPVTFTMTRNDAGRQTVQLHGNGRVLHTEHFDGEVYVLVTDKSAKQLGRAINPDKQGYKAEPHDFSIYNGSNGTWLSARSHEKAIRNLLATVGGIGAGLSLGPPEISAPLNALASGVRGASLLVRSVAPDATAVDTGLGRTLRGVEFVTFSISHAGILGHYVSTGDGGVQFQVSGSQPGMNNVQDGANLLGFSIYLTKSLEEASTGKKVMPWADDVALMPFALGGGIGIEAGMTKGSVYDVTMNALLTGAVTRLWFRDSRLGKKLGDWLPTPSLSLDRFIPAKLKKWEIDKKDFATIIGFSGTMIPSSVMAGVKLANEHMSEEPEDIDDELFGYVPSDFSPSTAPVVDAERENATPVLDKQPGVEEAPGLAVVEDIESQADSVAEDGGRINPLLEGSYAFVIVEPNQTLGGIAVQQKRDIEQVVMLNLDHILDPSMIFPGDRVYLPAA
ncbi:DUF4781 domain-containing protein [Halomonas binhaiensis]|uniref:DUF4781 domain-containing protein n=1 Tax=Halomonas binhaiensis TaxID=2562282 RepID=A0A856QU58_9GAMM|nr:DUF4781 domain-containing protein [Halomonas binhaiensis]QEM83462.2 DUF4781 domain-containing protein [Halomonas binhaiensis]